MNSKTIRSVLASCALLSVFIADGQYAGKPGIGNISIHDAFWSPKLKQWATVTANDVLDKFEGRFKSSPQEQKEHNTFINFDDVAAGKTATGHHAGLPWFDGLIYESIRGIGDLLKLYPTTAIEDRIDKYIDRIYAAQQADAEGYINTYTQLMEPTHRWGDNGGMLRWQHDVYNAGMLVEAGVHYYKATGKVKLLQVATRMANHMCSLMGPAPKRNIVPAHSGPEEALIKLYWLFKSEPQLKAKSEVPVNTRAYIDLAKFWIENRGKNSGYPLWLSWGNGEAEKWIREQKYLAKGDRPTWGDYAQDSVSVFSQRTIEGHAVRATLLATGIATMSLENRSQKYIRTAQNWWDNMVGRRMFITGGVGAIAHDEKFGPDYFLPPDAYLETCAAVGAGFFHNRMFEITRGAKYIDELERVLYNSLLTGISLPGDRYTYQNPLNARHHERWNWHDCPCCPPMFLKMVSSIPGYIYASDDKGLYINLFIGSSAETRSVKGQRLQINQQTDYPRSGVSAIKVDLPAKEKFTIRVRIPGWARGSENPFGLYESDAQANFILKINGISQNIVIENGYAVLNRIWQRGDRIELHLPMQPRIVTANRQVEQLKGRAALAFGPLIYCFEELDNGDPDKIFLPEQKILKTEFSNTFLNDISILSRQNEKDSSKGRVFKAIPYYAVGNRENGGAYSVWIKYDK